MGSRTKEIITYLILGVLSAVSIALIGFAFVQRRVCIEEGNLEAAGHCLMLGIVCCILLLLFLAAMAWTWKRSRRAETAREAAGPKWASPRFEKWYVRELDEIEGTYGKGKIIAAVFSVLLVFNMLHSIILLLDGMVDGLAVGSLIFQAGLVLLINYMADYERKYSKPLEASIRKVLPDPSGQEDFAAQMAGAWAFGYMAGPGSVMARAWLTPDYCYVRQPGQCGIIKNRDIGRVVLERSSYTVGVRHTHFRTCYRLGCFHGEGERKPFWSAYFKTKEDLYTVVSRFQRIGISPEKIQDKL